jgi:ParB-like chromosome segregation protein Spo0J
VIAPDLVPLAVPIDSLRELPGNPRRGDVGAVAGSLRRFGQRKPIVVRQDGTIIAGNHTWKAARELGWDQIAVVRVADDDQEALAFALADNRTGDLGVYDDEALLDLLNEVDTGPSGLAGTGYTDDDLAALLHLIEPPDLDDLADTIGDPTEDDGLVRVPVRLPAELAKAFEDALGNDHVAAVSRWLDGG